jgi:CRISPR/Cas system CSM-associated protein Csm3 (group 7 of RAMP superfamily)
MKYSYRYIARIVVEAERPLVVGGGNKELGTDRPVAKDANGLPYIPGTSLAGVLRHAIFAANQGNNEVIKKLKDMLGDDDDEDSKNNVGSRVAISSAHLIGKNNKVYDGLLPLSELTDDFIEHFLNLPVRQHVRITHKGVADINKKGKFDEEVLYKGTRLIFEIEMKGNKEEDLTLWKDMLKMFMHPDFRLGSGSRKGFGKIKIISIREKTLNLSKPEERKIYLNHSSSLGSDFDGTLLTGAQGEKSKYISYILHLNPKDFYLFGSGKKGNSPDIHPVTEQILSWDDDTQNPTFSKEMILIPSSSVKGAVSHRVALNYNKLCDIFADKLPNGKTIEDYAGENNAAVKALFGEAANHAKNNDGHSGNVLFQDVFLDFSDLKKLDHVAIDRFTGGAIDSALFNENVVKDKKSFDLKFYLDNGFLVPDGVDKNKVVNAFENTLKDICSGLLPLGGGTMRGNGVFTGTLEKK